MHACGEVRPGFKFAQYDFGESVLKYCKSVPVMYLSLPKHIQNNAQPLVHFPSHEGDMYDKR